MQGQLAPRTGCAGSCGKSAACSHPPTAPQKFRPIHPTLATSSTNASWIARANESDSNFVSGPISVNISNKAAPDPVTAASEPKATRPIDRSKGLWTRCDKCGVILYIKHLKVVGPGSMQSHALEEERLKITLV
ncbi:hypothetical protein DUNSADRAFT_10133 [Dunaliella salina]|uniref:Encoded protein n=1 Tax=Dunaliella salina TaxID=3046 RepID=A0ABQ7H530_DUNSA|nr:hypothetical protein DUNSADRAFT_10133 [Dunaliella salina]|eukprot:KAF5841962.1 hypothetical protein DUNSADRAFT_10133 [Dunaliella salina]